jgi:uncharacterized repeat protein (TIGR01451 family)
MGFDDGHVSFLGTSTPFPELILTTLGGVLRIVVTTGTVIDGKVASTFGTYGRGLDGNMVAFHVSSYGGLGLNAAFVAIASNDPPAAVADAFSVSEDGGRTFNVLGNDSDPDGDVFFLAGFTNPGHGTVSCTAAGACTYVPAANFNGADQFTYTVSDGRGGTAVGTVDVTVVAVDDADVAVSMKASDNPVGRGRTLTYTLVVSNAGPDTARAVTLTDTLPSGTTFAAAKTTQGVITAPAVGGTGTVSVAIGSLAPRTTVTVLLTVNVLSTALTPLVNTAQVSFDGADPALANNTAGTLVNVVSVGTFVLSPAHTTVAVGDHTRLALEWTIPGPSWRELKDLQLRVRDSQGTVLHVRLIEGTPMLLALHDDGRFGPAKEPGSPAVLSNRTAKVSLAVTGVKADGPTDPSVVMTLDVSFKRRAAGRTYVVEVKASDDLGNVQDWKQAGTLTVTRGPGGRDDD